MKITLAILFIFFLTAVCTDNHVYNKQPIIIEASAPSTLETDLKYLNSRIQLSRCRIQILNNQFEIDRLKKEHMLYKKSLKTVKQASDTSLINLDTLNISSNEKMGN